MEYNELTKQLLNDGYTVDNHPDYVQLSNSRFSGDNPLNNLDGGFEYKRYHKDRFVYKTGCGMYVKGDNVIDQMGYMGVEWCHENNNPVIRCPFDIPDCPNNDSRLHGTHGGGLCIQCYCACHRTDEQYDYDNSYEKFEQDRQDEKNRKYKEYSDAHKGMICKNHMYYDERTREWKLSYYPSACRQFCPNHYSYCNILNKELSKKRGNVYYDLKKSWTRKDGTLWDGETVTVITKGIRFFDNPISIDICKAFVKLQSDEIQRMYDINHSWEYYKNKTLKAEVINIRAESKPSRDLLADLEDIKSGITIIHDSDSLKLEKEQKTKKRKESQQKRIDKLEKVILEKGYYNLDKFGADKIHADKWLSDERIVELENMRIEMK